MPAPKAAETAEQTAQQAAPAPTPAGSSRAQSSPAAGAGGVAADPCPGIDLGVDVEVPNDEKEPNAILFDIAVGQASADGSLSFELGHIPAGRSFILFLDFQTNPTNVGHRHQTVTLYDGARKVLTVHRTITVFP